MSLLFFGGGFLFVVVGWSINEGHNFTLLSENAMEGKTPEFYRAIGLLLFVAFFSIVWVLSSIWI